MKAKHIVILGGGFAGIKLTLALGGNMDYRVPPLDKNNCN
jgi:NADH dehydrogenase FAD-containing subunit